MRRYIKMAIVLIFMVFILTGCTNTEYNVKVNKNGTGKVEYKAEFDEQILADQYEVGLSWIEDFNFLNKITGKAKTNGYNVEKIEKDGNTLGYKVFRDFNNIADFRIVDSVGDEYILIENDDGIKIEKGFFITKYSQNFTIDTTKGGEVINKIQVTYDFPKGIAKSNADNTSGTKLTWNLGQNEVRKIEYTVYAFNLPLIILLVVILIVAILLIKLVIKKKKKDRKENAELAGKTK